MSGAQALRELQRGMGYSRANPLPVTEITPKSDRVKPSLDPAAWLPGNRICVELPSNANGGRNRTARADSFIAFAFG